MGKFLLRFFILLLVIIFSFTIYLSYFGVETDKFNAIIKEKANKVNQNVKLEFNKTKIHLNPSELNLVVKLNKPKVLIKGNEINLSKIDLFLALKSFISSDFLLKRAEIDFFKNDIKDLVKISNIFLPKFINKKLNKIFSKGNMEGEFIIPFNPDGSVAENYQINAKLLDAKLNINKDFQIINLSTDIKYVFNSFNDKEINFVINQGNVLNLDLQKSSININLKDNKKIIKSKIKTSGVSNYYEIKIISSLLGFDLNNIINANLSSNLETSLKLLVSDRFKITNKEFSVKGKVNELNLEHKKIKDISKFLPSYNSKIILKDAEIKLDKTNDLKLSGLMKFNNQFEDFSLSFSNSSTNNIKNSWIKGKISLKDLSLKISNLNYYKEENTNADINFYLRCLKSGCNIKSLKYSSGIFEVKADLIMPGDNIKTLIPLVINSLARIFIYVVAALLADK